MRNFEDLEIWKRSCLLATSIYKAFEKCRDSGFYNQITRAAISIASNIAEGSERRTDKEFITFLYIARGIAGRITNPTVHCRQDRLSSKPIQK